eukprot:2330197-Rhodomonas_salina.1
MASLQPSALALHATQTPARDPVKPWAQKHWCGPVLARAETAFAAHATHGPEPFPSLYVPSGQAMHGPPAGPACPGSHLQSVGALLSGGDDACTGQPLQLDEPGAAYMPLGHATHAFCASAALNEPPGHLTQAPELCAVLNQPAAQAEQGPPETWPYPARQLQLAADGLCASARLCSGQEEQPAEPSGAYIPAGHSKHAPDPPSLLYVPTGHATHAPDPAES